MNAHVVDAPAARHRGLAYDVRGSGSIGVLLLHPAFTDGRVFEQLAAELGERYRVLTVDLPGHGSSTGPSPAPPAMADLPATIGQICDAEGIATLHVLGVSLGGVVAQDVACRLPDRVRSLTVVGAYERGDVVALRAQRGEMLRWLPLVAFAMGRFRRYVAEASTATAAGRARFLDRAAGFRRRGFLALRGMEAGAEPGRGDATRHPLWIVVGAHDLPVVRDAARRWHEREPGSRFDVVDGAGHVVPLDAPERFAHDLFAWLSEVDAVRASGAPQVNKSATYAT